MTQPQITPAGEDQPTSEPGLPPCRGEVAALAQEIAEIGGRPAEARESPGRCAGDFTRLDGQVAELTRLLGDLSQDQEGQLDENERLDRRLNALGQNVETQRHAIAELENRLDDLTALARERAERQPAGTGERAIWWPDLPAGQEHTAALRRLRAWVDDVLWGRHPELVKDSLQPYWYRHEDVVDELTALQAAWHAAYRGTATPATAAIEWHDRWLPGCLARCKTAIKARPCDTGGHPSPPGTEAPGDPAAVNEPAGPEVTASARAWCGSEPCRN